MSPRTVAAWVTMLLACERVAPAPDSARGAPPIPPLAAPAPATCEYVGQPTAICDGAAHSCQFAGAVTRARWEATIVAAIVTSASVRALLVELDDDDENCASLTGVQISLEDGPMAEPETHVSKFWLAMPSDVAMPTFAAGDRVCGTINRYGLGYDPGYQAAIFRNGVLELAYAHRMPRDASPLAGWRFRHGRERRRERTDEDYWLMTDDVIVEHLGERATINADDGRQQVAFADGLFGVAAEAYRTQGPLPAWMAWQQRSGYGFSIVRR